MEYELTDDDIARLEAVVDALAAKGHDPSSPAFYDQYWPSIWQVPVGIRTVLESFRRSEASAACIVTGFPLGESPAAPTPTHWEHARNDASTYRHELYLALCGMMLGEPFSWVTLQDGNLIQNILPIRGHESLQDGHGSEAFLEFHTEDAFHPERCDYLLLLGVRNDDGVPTCVSSMSDVTLLPEEERILWEKRFLIMPDNEHIRQLELSDPAHPALRQVRQMQSSPSVLPVLFGDPANPYVRFDKPFMKSVDDDPLAMRTLKSLDAEFIRVQREIGLGPGSLLILDNYRAVHARKAFPVRYDGTDRWLKKMTVSRNLRRGAEESITGSFRVRF
jgi:L-asparagine oxygenase